MTSKTQADYVLSRIDPARGTAIGKIVKWLGKPEQTVRNWVRKGYFPHEFQEAILVSAQNEGLPLSASDFSEHLAVAAIAANAARHRSVKAA